MTRFKQPKESGICDVCGGKEFKRRAGRQRRDGPARLKEYHEKTAPIVPYYKEKSMLRQVDGMASVEAVTRQIDAVLEGL